MATRKRFWYLPPFTFEAGAGVNLKESNVTNDIKKGRKLMEQGEVLRILQESVTTVIQVAAPVLLVGLSVGLLVSIFQAMTQINEQTLSFVPKILAILGSLVLFGSWMMTKLMEFTINLFENIGNYIQ